MQHHVQWESQEVASGGFVHHRIVFDHPNSFLFKLSSLFYIYMVVILDFDTATQFSVGYFLNRRWSHKP